MNLETVIIQTIVNGLLIGSIYTLSALGLTLIWGVMSIINFAHGSFFMLGMYASFWIFALLKIDPLFSLPIVFILFFLLGILYYKAVIKITLKTTPSFRRFSNVLTTYAVGIIIVALAIFFWSANYRAIKGHILQGSYNFRGIYIGIPEIYSGIICILGVLALFIFLSRTKIGRAIRATSINKEAAELVGIDVEYIYQLVLGLGIALVGVSGSLASNFCYIQPDAGAAYTILAFVTVAIGGFGSVQGALYGGLILGIIVSFSSTFIGPTYKYAIAYSMYLIVMYFKPRGLKGW